MDITLIAAHGIDRAIGQNGAIPWHHPEDFAHFRRETLGSALIMGRATFESIGRPLPDRHTIVVTRNPSYAGLGYSDSITVCTSLEESFTEARKLSIPIMVAGGAQIYEQAMPYATRQILTLIPERFPSADAFYPVYDEADWSVTRVQEDYGLVFKWLSRTIVN